MSTPRPETEPTGEFSLIRWIRDRTAVGGSTVLGIGDDGAIVRPSPGSDLVVTTDMLMDGRHFVLEEAGPEAVGVKALGVNLSDIAAMAARPIAAVVAIALPSRHPRPIEIARGLHRGLTSMADRFGVALVGGDTNAWEGPLVVCVTVFGETAGRGAVRRSGARPGDVIFVTGPLGGSLLGRHLAPEPRVIEALALNEAVALHALIDLSDGLSSDLAHILDESGGLGAVLDASAIPIHADAVTMSGRSGRTPLDHALGDGEDFELCLTVSADAAARLLALPCPPARLYRIGVVVEGPGLWLRQNDGSRSTIHPAGFDHLRRPSDAD